MLSARQPTSGKIGPGRGRADDLRRAKQRRRTKAYRTRRAALDTYLRSHERLDNVVQLYRSRGLRPESRDSEELARLTTSIGQPAVRAYLRDYARWTLADAGLYAIGFGRRHTVAMPALHSPGLLAEVWAGRPDDAAEAMLARHMDLIDRAVDVLYRVTDRGHLRRWLHERHGDVDSILFALAHGPKAAA